MTMIYEIAGNKKTVLKVLYSHFHECRNAIHECDKYIEYCNDIVEKIEYEAENIRTTIKNSITIEYSSYFTKKLHDLPKIDEILSEKYKYIEYRQFLAYTCQLINANINYFKEYKQ